MIEVVMVLNKTCEAISEGATTLIFEQSYSDIE